MEPRTQTGRVLLAGAALLLAVGLAPLEAQEPAPSIITDRPGTPDGAWVVGPGVWQIEAGAAALVDGGTGVALGQALLRIGVGPLEARIYPNSYVTGTDGEGLQDVGLGIKVPVVRGSSPLSLLAGATLPTGTGQAGGRGSSAFTAAIWETPLSTATTLNANIGYSFPFAEAGSGTVLMALTPGFTVDADRRISGYTGLVALLAPGSSAYLLEAGIAKPLHDNLQIDVNGGLPLRAGDAYIGVGIAYRWP